MISCGFFGSRFICDGEPYRNGILAFADTAEVFEAPLSVWTEDDYEKSWELALSTVVSRNDQRAAIITNFAGLAQAAYLGWWPIYRVDSSVVLREQILFLEQIRTKISVEHLFEFVPPRQLSTNDNPVSEWVLDLSEISTFLHCLRVARDGGV